MTSFSRPGSTGPLVSVVVPLYNKERQVKGTLQSVLDQTFTDFEVVVVNDGSTDDSAAVVQSFGDRIVYVEQNNRGPGAARNHGVEIARGKLIAFLDADDEWLPGKLLAQVEYMESRQHVMWCSVNGYQDDCGGPEVLICPLPFDHAFRDWVTFDNWFVANAGQTRLSTSSIMVRRFVFDTVGLFDKSIPAGQDTDMWIRIALQYPRFGFLERPLMRYHRQTPGCVSLLGVGKQRSMLRYLLKHAEQACRSGTARPHYKTFVRAKLTGLLRTSLATGNVDVARSMLRSAPLTWFDLNWALLLPLALLPSGVLRFLGRCRQEILGRFPR